MAKGKIKWKTLNIVDRDFLLKKMKKKSIFIIILSVIYAVFLFPSIILSCFNSLQNSPDAIRQIACSFVCVFFLAPIFLALKNTIVFVCILLKMGKITTLEDIGISPDYEENKKHFISVTGKKRKYKIRTLGIDGREVSLQTNINILAPIPGFKNVLFAIPVNKKSK